MDLRADQMAAGIGDDVAFAAVDPLTRVTAAWATAFGGLDRLAVDHPGRLTVTLTSLNRDPVREILLRAPLTAAGLRPHETYCPVSTTRCGHSLGDVIISGDGRKPSGSDWTRCIRSGRTFRPQGFRHIGLPLSIKG